MVWYSRLDILPARASGRCTCTYDQLAKDNCHSRAAGSLQGLARGSPFPLWWPWWLCTDLMRCWLLGRLKKKCRVQLKKLCYGAYCFPWTEILWGDVSLEPYLGWRWCWRCSCWGDALCTEEHRSRTVWSRAPLRSNLWMNNIIRHPSVIEFPTDRKSVV